MNKLEWIAGKINKYKPIILIAWLLIVSFIHPISVCMAMFLFIPILTLILFYKNK